MTDRKRDLSGFVERRNQALAEVALAQIDKEDAEQRLAAAQKRVEKINEIILQMRSGMEPEFVEATSAHAIPENDEPKVRRGRPKGSKNKTPETIVANNASPMGAIVMQPEPSADEIRQKRLSNRAQKKSLQESATAAKIVSRKLSVKKALPSEVIDKMPTRRKHDGAIRQAVMQALITATKNKKALSVEEVVDDISSMVKTEVIPGSIRTILYTLRRQGLTDKEGGKWRVNNVSKSELELELAKI